MGVVWDYVIVYGLFFVKCFNVWCSVMCGEFKSKGVCIKGVYCGLVKCLLLVNELVVLLLWFYYFISVNEDILMLFVWICVFGKEICVMYVCEIS